MSTVAFIEGMLAAGFTTEEALRAAKVFEQVQTAEAPARPVSKAAERTRRWREKRHQPSRGDACDVTTVTSVTDVTNSPSLPSPPDPPIPPTPTRESPLPPRTTDRRKPRRALPADFPTEELITAMQAEARAEGANVDLRRFAKTFRDQCTAKDYRYADWPAAWRKWCRDQMGRAPKTAVASLAGRPAAPDPNRRWTSAVREFRANGYWPRDDLGPPPGREGCRCPPEVLAAHGIAQPKPVANDLFPQEQAV